MFKNLKTSSKKNLINPVSLLILMSIAMPIAFNAWAALLNNFVVEKAAFTGVEIGILQSLREIPGFLAFTMVFVLLVIKEQIFAVFALALLGLGVAITGFFPTVFGLYFTTVLMSIGFHYFEAVKQSLSLQWLSKEEAPQVLGRLIAVGSFMGTVRNISGFLFSKFFYSRRPLRDYGFGYVFRVPYFSCENYTE